MPRRVDPIDRFIGNVASRAEDMLMAMLGAAMGVPPMPSPPAPPVRERKAPKAKVVRVDAPRKAKPVVKPELEILEAEWTEC